MGSELSVLVSVDSSELVVDVLVSSVELSVVSVLVVSVLVVSVLVSVLLAEVSVLSAVVMVLTVDTEAGEVTTAGMDPPPATEGVPGVLVPQPTSNVADAKAATAMIERRILVTSQQVLLGDDYQESGLVRARTAESVRLGG